MKSVLCEMLGIDYPIIQGAMAWVADADLASAVSNAGGLGLIGTGHDPVDVVNHKIADMKTKTDKPFGVNIMLLNQHVEDVVDAVCASGVKVVTTGAGSPGRYMEKFKAAGIKVIPVVASVALARRMEKMALMPLSLKEWKQADTLVKRQRWHLCRKSSMPFRFL